MSAADTALTAELGHLRKRLIEKDALIESKEAQIVSLSKRCAEKAKRVIELESKLIEAKDDLILEGCAERCAAYSTCKDQDCKAARAREQEAIDRRVEIGERREVPK